MRSLVGQGANFAAGLLRDAAGNLLPFSQLDLEQGAVKLSSEQVAVLQQATLPAGLLVSTSAFVPPAVAWAGLGKPVCEDLVFRGAGAILDYYRSLSDQVSFLSITFPGHLNGELTFIGLEEVSVTLLQKILPIHLSTLPLRCGRGASSWP